MSDAGEAGEEDGWKEVQGRNPAGKGEAGPSQPRAKKAQPCGFWAKGHCARGDKCWFSHDGPRGKQLGKEPASEAGPSRAAKPRPAGAAQGGPIKNGPAGKLMYSPQVDPSDPRYKSMMCHHFTRGCCGHGDACSFAHSKVELRAGQAQGSGRGTSAEGRGSGGSSADGSAGEMAPDQAAARPQPQRGVRKENGHAAAHGEHAANGNAVAADAGDDVLSDAMEDLNLDFEDVDEDLAPESFCCPITHELMKNPVVACDGYTYERKGIQDWLKMKDTSPMTNEPMESKDLVPNRALRAIIRVLYAPN